MPATRLTSWTLLAAAGFALAAARAPGQPPKDDFPLRPTNAGDIGNYRAYGIPAGATDKAKETFKNYAEYIAALLTNLRVYTTPQEFKSDAAKTTTVIPTVDQILRDLELTLLVPDPNSKVGPDNADYIRELGVAYDAALGKLPENPEQVMAVNGARALAAACKSGATAHYPTVTKLLGSEAVRPEAKYYLLQAAENLLAAYDLNNLQFRNHSAGPAEVGALVAALQAAVERPTSILPAPPGPDGKPAAGVPDDLVPVLHFVRRQAVRALGQVRFAEVAAGKDKTLYPAFTLARVAMSDPALGVPPNPAELAEAVLGLCNMSPPRALGTEPYAYAMSDAVASGLAALAAPKAQNAADKSIPWRGTAGRLADGLRLWQGVFDPNYNPARPAAANPGLVPPVVAKTAAEAERLVLGPLDAGGRVNTPGLVQYRDAVLRADPKYKSAPFRSNPSLVLPVKK
ncbi:MAG: hypothetical protein K2X82_07075 [Gemmataceae bacterium]|nr:hypothetical protein [Gemmataceae bacterium]